MSASYFLRSDTVNSQLGKVVGLYRSDIDTSYLVVSLHVGPFIIIKYNVRHCSPETNRDR